MLLAKEEAVLQGMTERVFEIVMEMDVEETNEVIISRQPSLNTKYDGLKTAEDCGKLQVLG